MYPNQKKSKMKKLILLISIVSTFVMSASSQSQITARKKIELDILKNSGDPKSYEFINVEQYKINKSTVLKTVLESEINSLRDDSIELQSHILRNKESLKRDSIDMRYTIDKLKQIESDFWKYADSGWVNNYFNQQCNPENKINLQDNLNNLRKPYELKLTILEFHIKTLTNVINEQSSSINIRISNNTKLINDKIKLYNNINAKNDYIVEIYYTCNFRIRTPLGGLKKTYATIWWTETKGWGTVHYEDYKYIN